MLFVFVLTFPHPGLYWIYGNKDDNDDDIQWPVGQFGFMESENKYQISISALKSIYYSFSNELWNHMLGKLSL
jgi:hypothetical protein